MALSKEKQEQLAQAYKNIKKITGLKFDEKDVDQVANALGQIYINGHNLWRGIQNWGKIQSVIDARIFEVSDILNRVQKGNNADFISIMKPDDPYAVPRIIEPDTEEKREAAEAYEENFRENHRKNIAKLREDLAGSIIKNKMTDSRNYFREELLNEGGGFKNTNSYIRELGNRVTDAVNMCNTVLLGRGYTMEELLGDSEEVREARKMVGLEMEELMYGEISPEEKERKFRGFLEESKIGLEKLRMKHVDYSDDSTLDNARYNAMIASMVTNVYQVIQSAESTIQSPWLKEMDEYFVTLKNFTDGIGFLDNRRIQEINGIAVMADTMFNQLLIDRMGTDYDAYRTAPLGMAKNNCSLAFLMQNDIDDSAGSMGYDEAGEEYQKAYDKFAQTGSTEEYKKLLNDYVEKNETVFREAEKNIKIAAEGREILPKEDSYAAWFEGTPGMTVDDYKKGIREAFKGGSQTAQIDRSPTLSNLFLAYGVYEAEKNGQEISLQEFFTNRELQKETGRKAYEFFTNHPMTGKTEEESAENVKAFGQVIAALNRKLQNTEIPKYDYKDPEKAAEMQEYLKNFQTLMVDSHQLNGVIPKGLRDVFLEEQGGAEKYQETLNQINIAKAIVNAEQRVQAGQPLEKKNFKEIFDRTAVLSESCTGAYVLKTEGEKYLGKKIGECPTDEQAAMRLDSIMNTGAMEIGGRMNKIAETKEGQKQLLEYAVSFGEKDPAGLDQQINEVAEACIERGRINEELMRQVQAEERKAARENPHNWYAESTPDEWKARLERLYAEVDSHDPALLRSSAEYKAVKQGLREAAKAVNDRKKFNEIMDSVFQSAGDYINVKEHSQVGSHYGQERLEVITDLRDSLAGRDKKSLSPERIGDLFGTGDTTEEMLESGMNRIALYMHDINMRLKNPEEREQARKDGELIDRVLAEKGKNKATRDKLREKLAQKDAEITKTDKKTLHQMMDKDVLPMVGHRVGMNAKEVGWYRLADAYRQMLKKDPSPEIQALADTGKIRRAMALGSLAETAMNAKVRSFAAGESQPLSKNEIGAVVANKAIVSMLSTSGTDGFNRDMVKKFLKEKETAKDISAFFADSEAGQKLMQQNERGNSQKYIFGSKVQKATAERGEYHLFQHMAPKMVGIEAEQPQPVKQNTVQKNKPMRM